MFRRIVVCFCSVFLVYSSVSAADFIPDFSENTMSYSSVLKMREELRMGAGLSLGGPLGVWGVNTELNFEDENAAIVGLGGGPGYQSIELAWKHAFDGDYLAPYAAAGFSHWYNASSKGDEWKNSSILNRILTVDERRQKRFGADFINLAVGLQYNQLAGSFYGLSFYAEIVAMLELKTAQLIPSGTVGSTYYF